MRLCLHAVKAFLPRFGGVPEKATRWILISVAVISMGFSLGGFMNLTASRLEDSPDCRVVEIALAKIIEGCSSDMKTQLILHCEYSILGRLPSSTIEEIESRLPRAASSLIEESISRGNKIKVDDAKIGCVFTTKNMQIDNLGWISKFKGTNISLKRAFEMKYPHAVGYAWVYTPGYSKDSRTALVLVETGPSIHMRVWACVLVRSRNSWDISSLKCIQFE